MANLDKLTQFFLQARSEADKPFVRQKEAITPSDYFSLKRVKELLSNPLLTPEWVQVTLKGKPLPLESDYLWKMVQVKKLCFLDKARMDEAISKGASVVLEGLDILDPGLHAVCAEIDAQLPCAISNCEAFFSQRNNEAYGGHCDSDDVLVMQLEGQKRWRIHQPQPRRYVGNSPMNEQQMGPLLAELVMNPGDIMFLRAGVPHRCITEVPYSLHLSFDLCDRTPNIEEITQAANQVHAERLAPMNAPAPEVVDHYIQHLKSERFTKLLTDATANKKTQATRFRQQMGKVGKITAFDKFL
ncbi:MAG: cupin domain-containing protein [Hylemonella sp.]|nr:cupin domain-containing protein [Hylemonella sp.]